MSTLPPNLSGGSPAPTHADFNALRKFAIENALTSGAPGLRRRAFGGGSLVNPITGRRPRGFFAVNYPLDLTLTDAGATFTGTFRPGHVNGLIPSNFLSLTGIAKTGTVYIKIDVTLTNAAVQTAAFAATGTAPPAMPTTMGVPPTTVAILTHVVVAGTVYRVLGTGNPYLTASASFETDKVGAISPGERSTDVWYTYNLTSIA